MLNSGLRIGDAMNIERTKIADTRLTLRAHKKNVHVSLSMSPDVVAARMHYPPLPRSSSPLGRPGRRRSSATIEIACGSCSSWRRDWGLPPRVQAHIGPPSASQRVPAENVSKILGHSSTMVTVLHCSPWMNERQELLDESVKRTWGEIATTKSATKGNQQESRSGKSAATG